MPLEHDETRRLQVAGQAEGGAEATRNALMNAGMRLFGSKGFDAASIRDVLLFPHMRPRGAAAAADID